MSLPRHLPFLAFSPHPPRTLAPNVHILNPPRAQVTRGTEPFRVISATTTVLAVFVVQDDYPPQTKHLSPQHSSVSRSRRTNHHNQHPGIDHLSLLQNFRQPQHARRQYQLQLIRFLPTHRHIRSTPVANDRVPTQRLRQMSRIHGFQQPLHHGYQQQLRKSGRDSSQHDMCLPRGFAPGPRRGRVTPFWERNEPSSSGSDYLNSDLRASDARNRVGWQLDMTDLSFALLQSLLRPSTTRWLESQAQTLLVGLQRHSYFIYVPPRTSSLF